MKGDAFITLEGILTFSGATGAVLILGRIWDSDTTALLIISLVIGGAIAFYAMAPIWKTMAWREVPIRVIIALVNTAQIYFAAITAAGVTHKLLLALGS